MSLRTVNAFVLQNSYRSTEGVEQVSAEFNQKQLKPFWLDDLNLWFIYFSSDLLCTWWSCNPNSFTSSYVFKPLQISMRLRTVGSCGKETSISLTEWRSRWKKLVTSASRDMVTWLWSTAKKKTFSCGNRRVLLLCHNSTHIHTQLNNKQCDFIFVYRYPEAMDHFT